MGTFELFKNAIQAVMQDEGFKASSHGAAHTLETYHIGRDREGQNQLRNLIVPVDTEQLIKKSLSHVEV